MSRYGVICFDSASEDEEEVVNTMPITRSMSRKIVTSHLGTSTTQDVRELVPDVTEIIELLEEVPKQKKTQVVFKNGLNISLDADEYISDEEMEETIRTVWDQTQEIKRFYLKPSDKMESVFKYYAEKSNLPIEKVRITDGDVIISLFDTVKSLDLKVAHVLHANAVKEGTNSYNENITGKIEIKCLLKDVRKPLIFHLHPNQNLDSIRNDCAKELQCSAQNIVLWFDGQKVSPVDTPNSLELEGGECIEVHK